ncbi:MAG: NPCBM/NEW2 domain-containing protein [Pirellulaceae bacterium]
MIPPPPPLPAVYVSDLPFVKGTTGLGDRPRLNLSITDKPISVAGWIYEKGVGVHANSELEYELPPEYRRFVAVVGVDDAMKNFPQASVIFKVIPVKDLDRQQGPAALAGVTPLYESPVLRANEAWTIYVCHH